MPEIGPSSLPAASAVSRAKLTESLLQPETLPPADPAAADPHSLAGLFPSGAAPRLVIRPTDIAPPAEDARPDPADLDAAIEPLVELLSGKRIAVLTGAGISTDSGVPDYRSPGSAPRRPMTHQQFISAESFRRHYWARNHLGWEHLAAAQPNAGHRALAAMEDAGHLTGLITQNIDMLHARAGSRHLVPIHGRYDRVRCLSCDAMTPRAEFDGVLESLNPGWRERVKELADLEVAPDADVVLKSTADFRIADCARCGGILQPDVVFFGQNSSRERVERASAIVDQADVLLVAGSSLAVMGGLRYVRRAAKAAKRVGIINRGSTRGDELATVRVHAGTSETLSLLAARL
ncbi:NAD-dependent SIR2 family protein deacetylase [Bogoriella caseilytica]|uniref:protein acetyllysine N-acetyltransferase n=1 Tax=Bogoriella caseilytica TaxID=56055 RepID=A0A3N2BBI5_9MICO|nr:NAD-dependent SIR2 family protein deacetylase [Bogoriella caseilytica]